MAKRRRGYPRGIGAMEKAIGQLDTWIGEHRKIFQNVRRTNLALGLMRVRSPVTPTLASTPASSVTS